MFTSFNNQESLAELIAQMQGKKPDCAIKAEVERKKLPKNFSPGKYDVICARGKVATTHSGNIIFRQLIQKYKSEYAQAKSKLEKSIIVSKVVDSVRDNSPDGGFVKKVCDQWYEVGDSVAREKIGQCLRDQLHSKYKSSTRAKKGRRQELREQRKQQLQEEKKTSQGYDESDLSWLPPVLAPGESAFLLGTEELNLSNIFA